jgi:hypothetical protein
MCVTLQAIQCSFICVALHYSTQKLTQAERGHLQALPVRATSDQQNSYRVGVCFV